MEMAFPVPEHLPRQSKPQDISTQILNKISETSLKSLTASAASAWVGELDASIRQTKEQIQSRINDDLPSFERHLASSKSAQERLKVLTENVDGLDNTITRPGTGIIPKLVRELSSHASLAQKTADAAAAHSALAHLSMCRQHYQSMTSLAFEGKLANAVREVHALEDALVASPTPLRQSGIFGQLQNKLRVIKSRIEEQLGDAYARSVIVSPTEIVIMPSVPVGQPASMATISLPEIMLSLSSSALATHLATLRRDLIAHYIEFPLSQSTSLTLSDDGSLAKGCRLELTPAPPDSKHPPHTQIENLSKILHFLSLHLLSTLPESGARTSFPQSLSKPLSQALLSCLLVPSIPQSQNALPAYLDLLKRAVEFEDDVFPNVLHDMGSMETHEVRTWATNVKTHYEKKRRADILAATRSALLTPDTEDKTFTVDITVRDNHGAAPLPNVIVEQGDEPVVEDDAWGFGDVQVTAPAAVVLPQPKVDIAPAPSKKVGTNGRELANHKATPSAPLVISAAPVPIKPTPTKHNVNQFEEDKVDTDDSWGFDDDGDGNTSTATTDSLASPPTSTAASSVPPPVGEPDAWGLDDDPAKSADNSWDDPWGNASNESKPAVQVTPIMPSLPPALTPLAVPSSPAPSTLSPSVLSPSVLSPGTRRATRLERLANKKTSGSSAPSRVSSPPPSALPKSPRPTSPPPPPLVLRSPAQKAASAPLPFRAPEPARPPSPTPVPPLVPKPAPIPVQLSIKETYVVSERTKDVLNIVESAVRESTALALSNPFAKVSFIGASDRSEQAESGALILQASAAALDLFRGLYAVKLATPKLAAGKAMRCSNDALYLSGEIERVLRVQAKGMPKPAKGKIEEAQERLKAIGEAWYNDALDKQVEVVLEALAKAHGFVDTADQEVFDTCEEAVSEVVRTIRSVSAQWKKVLNKSKYFTSLGALVDSALDSILEDVLALDDIPEVESHRLAELCRMLNALEGLFMDSGSESSLVVTYVPSWLKFSYLSELLEASIADIMYLFEERALVDFNVDEIVKLVRALFADTPLRANAINKLTAGHPIET